MSIVSVNCGNRFISKILSVLGVIGEEKIEIIYSINITINESE